MTRAQNNEKTIAVGEIPAKVFLNAHSLLVKRTLNYENVVKMQFESGRRIPNVSISYQLNMNWELSFVTISTISLNINLPMVVQKVDIYLACTKAVEWPIKMFA